VLAFPAFHQPVEQRETGLLRRRPLVHGEQFPDLLLKTSKIWFGFDRPRSVSHPSIVLVMYGSAEAYLDLLVLCTYADGSRHADRARTRASDAKLLNAIIPWTPSLCRLASLSTN